MNLCTFYIAESGKCKLNRPDKQPGHEECTLCGYRGDWEEKEEPRLAPGKRCYIDVNSGAIVGEDGTVYCNHQGYRGICNSAPKDDEMMKLTNDEMNHRIFSKENSVYRGHDKDEIRDEMVKVLSVPLTKKSLIRMMALARTYIIYYWSEL
jgi:hypothetical protein